MMGAKPRILRCHGVPTILSPRSRPNLCIEPPRRTFALNHQGRTHPAAPLSARRMPSRTAQARSFCQACLAARQRRRVTRIAANKGAWRPGRRRPRRHREVGGWDMGGGSVTDQPYSRATVVSRWARVWSRGWVVGKAAIRRGRVVVLQLPALTDVVSGRACSLPARWARKAGRRRRARTLLPLPAAPCRTAAQGCLGGAGWSGLGGCGWSWPPEAPKVAACGFGWAEGKSLRSILPKQCNTALPRPPPIPPPPPQCAPP